MDKEIKFGFWNYAPYGILGVEQIDFWKKSGFNLPMSFRFVEGKTNISNVLSFLNECNKEGVKVIINDDRLDFRKLKTEGRERYVKKLKEVHSQYGDNPSIYGFYVGDEPSIEETDIAIEAYKLINIEMPHGKHFLNLLPYWGSSDPTMEISQKPEVFEEVLEKVLKQSQASYIGYDHYSQMLREGLNQEDGVSAYFYDLDQYQKITKENGASFYISLLSVGHWLYRVPTADDIRWQISTAFAHGARGIFWFYYYQNALDLSYRGGPFEGQNLYKNQPLCDAIAIEQNKFIERYKKYFDRMELVKVAHVGHLYDPKHRFVADDFIEDISVTSPYPICISYYKEFDSPKYYASFVNLDFKRSNHAVITFRNGNKASFYIAPGELILVDPNNASILGETGF